MRGAGGAPRGLRAHQKPLQERDRHRMLTRHQIWPRSLRTSVKQPKWQRTAGRPPKRAAPARPTQQADARARDPKQASHRPIRLMNKFSSSYQIWPEGQENFLQGHQNRPANRSLTASTIGQRTSVKAIRREQKPEPTTEKTAVVKVVREPDAKLFLLLHTSKGCRPPKLKRIQSAAEGKERQKKKKSLAKPRR